MLHEASILHWARASEHDGGGGGGGLANAHAARVAAATVRRGAARRGEARRAAEAHLRNRHILVQRFFDLFGAKSVSHNFWFKEC